MPPSVGALPTGPLELDGIPFRPQAPLRLTGMQDAREGRLHPHEIRGIAVGRSAAILHLLHALDGTDKDGTPSASLILHYDSGPSETVRLAAGVHARNDLPAADDSGILHDPNSRLAWQGTNRVNTRGSVIHRLFRTAIANPRPKDRIVSVDLVSLFSRATPYVVALTSEDAPAVTRLLDPRVTRVVRRSRAYDDNVYRDTLVLQARDRAGRPITNAEASLTISEGDQSYYFGSARADASGRISLVIPRQNAAELAAIVRAPGHLPFVHSTRADAPTSTAPANAGSPIPTTLETGTRIGGFVRALGGQLLGGATLSIYHLQQVSPREFNRLDYDTVTTDASGRWVSTSVPADLAGFQLAVRHPDHRPSVVSIQPAGESTKAPGPAQGQTPTVTLADLRAGQASITLDPSPRLAGTVKDSAGSPVAGAEIRLFPTRSNDGPPDDLDTRTDANGRYQIAVPIAGTYGVAILPPNHAPVQTSVLLREGQTEDFNPVVQAGRPLNARVVDQFGDPIPGAKARLETWSGLRVLKFETEADATGRFTWTNAPTSGQLRFYVSATNYSSTTYSFTPGSSEQRFTLRKLSSVRGLVIDAETKKPISEFTVYRGRAYNQDEPIRWERYNSTRGRNGEYSMRLLDSSSGSRSAILVEAPGYLPAASPPFTKAGFFTNDFALRKGRGVHGTVLAPTGAPASGANVALIEPAENAWLRPNGELQRSGDASMIARTTPRGEFQFQPKLQPHTLLVTHTQGFAELRITNPLAPVTVTLQPWATITGNVRVPPPAGGSNRVVLGNAHNRYRDDSRDSEPLSLSMDAPVAPDGSFAFSRVPPGERRVSLNYAVRRGDSTHSADSHGLALSIPPGGTTNLVIGGSGRTVTGRMKVVGADPADVDWRRDFHSLSFSPPVQMNLPAPDFSKARTQEEQQALWALQRKAEADFWRTPAGRSIERQQRSYVLQFSTNGTFRVEGVTPGTYQINVAVTESSGDEDSWEQIGYLYQQVEIPAAPAGQPNAPLDLGALEIPIRATLRAGRRAPPFQVKRADGTPARNEDFRGRYLLIDFWATWAGGRNYDLPSLKTIHERYGKDPRFAMLGINLDHTAAAADEELKRNPLPWPQASGGSWNDSPLRVAWNLRGLPDAYLIDPEGRVVSLNLRGPNILRTIERILQAPQTDRAPATPGPVPPRN